MRCTRPTAGRRTVASLRGQARESFAVLFPDARHALPAFENLLCGTLTQTEVHLREVLKRARRHNASAVILTHNQPTIRRARWSHRPRPSRDAG